MAKSNFPFPIEGSPQKIYFSTSARIAKLLGQDSVADPVIALLELIKNSYDADATEVSVHFENMRQGSPKIIVVDNGIGMTDGDIHNKWMRAATNNKEHETTSKLFKRRKIGEKGVGRFATQGLAKKITLVSKAIGTIEGFGLLIDWSDFEKNADDDFEKIPNQIYPFTKKKAEHGLEIHLESLNEKWGEEQIKRFHDDVSLVIPPTGGPQKFRVQIIADEFEKYSGKVKSSFLKEADYSFIGKLDRNGSISYSFTPYGGKTYKAKAKLTQFSCGPVEFQLYFYYLGSSDYIPKKNKDSRNFQARKSILQDFAGIKLYRDNFRIKPFGDPGNDWLGINKDRVNDPSNYPSNNQIFGFVKLKRDDNPGVNDTTSRENIHNSKEFLDLKKFIKGSIKFFANKRNEIEGKGKNGKTKMGSKKSKKNVIKDVFKKSEVKKNQIPQDLIDALPTNIGNILNEVNGCMAHGFLAAGAILLRKSLESALILKFVQEKAQKDITDTNGEYMELPAIVSIAKQKHYINSTLSRKIDKVKLLGDTAAHSYRIVIRAEDIEPIRDIVRLAVEDLSLES